MGKVETISTCIVAIAAETTEYPSPSPPPVSRILDLTPWDLQLLPIDPIQKGILFHKPPQSLQTLIPHLKHSLSRTLRFFPPLAGRLASSAHRDATSTFSLHCNNAGVHFVHALAAATSISDILDAKFTPKIVSSFFPHNGVLNCEGVSNPLLAVQVTELSDGLFIACTANHAVVDGVSFWHFFNSWSEISRGCHTISKTPVFKPWFPANVSNGNIQLRLPPLQPNDPSAVPPPLLERVLHFSKETLARLKARANSEAGTDKISTLQALSAHLWRSVTRCRYSEITLDDHENMFMIIVGARPRIPLAEGYFGNALLGAKMTLSAAELVNEDVGYAAARINELVAKQSKEVIEKAVEDWVDNPSFIRVKGIRFAFYMSSSPRHNVYGNDFGWGKPIAVRSGPGQKADGKMTLFPAAEAGGIDVEACLAPETLQALEDDVEFMEVMKWD